ncbi:MAG: serine--tRNA ligase [Actinobacteria bacterium]|nr:MAG: serine--tRNA ligase [Actinomycetota bacterium]
MIDLRAARADPEAFRAAVARKSAAAAEAFEELLAADERWRELVPQVDELRGRQKLKGKPTPEQVEELKQVKEELRRLEEELATAAAQRDELLQKVPNPPHESVPDEMEDDAEGKIARVVGEPPDLASARDHLELGRIEMERGARLSGSRFGYIVGDAALLTLALYRWALDRVVAQGFQAVIPPVLAREEAMYGTGFFPAERFEIYEIVDEGLFLTGTSEVALAGLHMGEILDADELPLRYTAFSTNFRREAGAAGRDTRGMFRVHQFNKVEMFCYLRPEESWEEHERLLAIEESLASELGLPYRVVNIAASELSAAAAKRYDLEAWFPSQQRYRELTSASNTTDYQSRRLGIRYRANGGTEYAHTLNGTAVTDRWALAVVENFQNEDGSVTVPPPLVEFGAPPTLG